MRDFRMSKSAQEKTYDELAQDLCTRADGLTHLTAKAEMSRREALETRRHNRYMLASVIVAAVSAIASAVSAYYAYLSTVMK